MSDLLTYPDVLLPRVGGVLLSDPAVAHAAPWFASLFRDAWSRLPPQARGPLTILFQVAARRQGGPRPLVRLLPCIDPAAATPEGWYVYGRCRPDWCEIEFALESIRLLPDPLVQAVIAHELAHAWLYAVGRLTRRVDFAEWRREAAVDEAATAWGFPMRELAELGRVPAFGADAG